MTTIFTEKTGKIFTYENIQKVLLIIMFFTFIDMVMTPIGWMLGFQELNPVVRGFSTVAFIALKICIIIALALNIYVIGILKGNKYR